MNTIYNYNVANYHIGFKAKTPRGSVDDLVERADKRLFEKFRQSSDKNAAILKETWALVQSKTFEQIERIAHNLRIEQLFGGKEYQIIEKDKACLEKAIPLLQKMTPEQKKELLEKLKQNQFMPEYKCKFEMCEPKNNEPGYSM